MKGKSHLHVPTSDGDGEMDIVRVDYTRQMKLTNNTSQDRFPVRLP